MKVITLLNEKGGVGKTTLATHIAAGLALSGSKVLIVDADPQGNATTAMGVEQTGSMYDLAVRRAAWKDVMQFVHPDVYSPPDATASGQLFALSGNVETRNIATSISDASVFIDRFAELSGAMDYIIVDTSPTPSLLHATICLATDYVLLPTECEVFSAFSGLANTIIHTQDVRRLANKRGIEAARILGIIPNKYRSQTVAHNLTLDQLKERYGEYIWEPIRQSITYAEAGIANQLIFGYAPDSNTARALWEVIEQVRTKVDSYEQA